MIITLLEDVELVAKMYLAALMMLLVASSSFSYSSYEYALSISIQNGQDELLPDSPSSPLYAVLNQNVFKNTSFQTSKIVSVTLDGAPVGWHLTYDAEGNPWIIVHSGDPLPPLESTTLSITFSLNLSKPEITLQDIGDISDVPKDILNDYPMVGVWNLSSVANASGIIDTALSIKGDEENALSVVLNIIQWFEDNMVYSSDLTVPKSLSDTFESRSGDCDDQSSLFVAFCRILGIPAYYQVGPIFIPGSQQESEGNLRFNLTNVGWHGWAMVYLPTGGGGEWIPVDLTYFKNAHFTNGHITSNSLLDHITGSALLYYDTASFLDVITSDYVHDSIALKETIMDSDCIWIEVHSMTPSDLGNAAVALDAVFVMLLAALLSFIMLVLLLRRNRRIWLMPAVGARALRTDLQFTQTLFYPLHPLREYGRNDKGP